MYYKKKLCIVASTKACSSSQGSSRGTCDDIGRLSDVFCMSPDTPSCDFTFPGITIDKFKC